jgi:uncharacterized phage-associated protein
MARIRFLFRFNRSLQAAGYFLTLAGGSMPYKKLLKLLYITDRECLKEEKDSLTGDLAYAMANGPVPGTIYNLIKSRHSHWERWQKYIRYEASDKSVSLVGDTCVDNLYRYEKDIIKRVFAEYGSMPEAEICEITKNFPEWKKYENAELPCQIFLEDILEALDMLDSLPFIEKEIDSERWYVEVLGAVL